MPAIRDLHLIRELLEKRRKIGPDEVIRHGHRNYEREERQRDPLHSMTG